MYSNTARTVQWGAAPTVALLSCLKGFDHCDAAKTATWEEKGSFRGQVRAGDKKDFHLALGAPLEIMIEQSD